MKKLVVLLVILALLASSLPVQAVAPGRGGLMGFIAGCCFGVRAAGDYNSGKEIHWREWVMLLPYINIIFAIWNGIDGANGVTKEDLAARYGAMYY